jgi:4-carboxymuconolactone decarboxylase
MRIIVAIVISLIMLTPAAQSQTPSKQGSIVIARSGSQPSRQALAEHFTGSIRVDPLFQAESPARASGSLVTFVSGARTAWHTHALGQILIVTAGTGRVQRWGNPVEEIRQGDVVWIPPGQKHWHGAAPGTSMAHIAISEQLDDKGVEWMEKVSDAQYGAPIHAQAASMDSGAKPRPSQGPIGDFAPKLAQLTDDVLYGDVWERPELSKRNRSLVIVAALIALNRSEQLRSPLVKARENGVNAINVARDVFNNK